MAVEDEHILESLRICEVSGSKALSSVVFLLVCPGMLGSVISVCYVVFCTTKHMAFLT